MTKTKHNILLSPDAPAEVDPLSGAAEGWEAPKFPVLAPDRLCEFEVKSAKKVPKKDDPSRQVLEIVLKTTKDYPDKEGKTLRAGFTIFHRISVTPTEGEDGKRARTWENIGEDLGMVLKAAGGEFRKKEPRDLFNNPSIIDNAILTCKVGISKETAEFPESNRLKFVPAT
jgi:hypothetical protein